MKTLIFLVTLFSCSYLHASDVQNALLSKESLKKDLLQLYTDLKASHVNLFENVTEQEYDTYFEKLYKSLSAPKTQLQAHILFQKFVAFGQVAHANIGFPEQAYQSWRDNGGKAFPIYVRIENERWFIAENYSGIELPDNAQITHIDGIEVKDWLAKLHQYISADTKQIASSLLEYQLPQYMWLLAQEQGESVDQYLLTLKTAAGDKDFLIPSLDRKSLQAKLDASPNQATEDTQLREYRLLNNRVAYLKPGPFYNAESPTNVWDNTNFVAFIDQAFEHFIEHKSTHLIIDVRQNPGGTNSFSDPLIAWFATQPFKFASQFLVRSSAHAQASNEKRLLQSQDSKNSVSHQLAQSYQMHTHGKVFNFPLEEAQPRKKKQFKGEVFVLIDRSSYSNAVSLAAIVKDYGFGTVIGESTADFATTLASMETFTLNESGLAVGFPKAHIIRPSGDKNPGPVIPDIELKSFEIKDIIALSIFQ
jgi:C-terminal processing protease CtpA/Prc